MRRHALTARVFAALRAHLALAAAFAGTLALSGCLTMSPDTLSKHVEVVVPEQAAKTTERLPVVIMLQGTGGGNIRPELWTGWFNSIGIATVIIDNARARGRSTLDGVPAYTQAQDVSVALDIIKNHPRVDLTRYAVMGFSRGGTAALEVGSVLKSEQPKPQFIFALYPGLNGGCPNSHSADTKVLVFYGALDDWGSFMNTRDGCRRMTETNSNASFHLLHNAHHGYDDTSSVQWSCCGSNFTSKPNKAATDETRQIILDAIQGAWRIRL